MAKASDNAFPSLLVVPGAAPAAPAAGQQRLYLDSADGNKLKRKDSAGTVVLVEGGGSTSGGSTPVAQQVNPEVTTASQTYVSLTGGPAVTVTVPASGVLTVTVGFQNTGTVLALMSFALSGANTLAASDDNSVLIGTSRGNSKTLVVTGLAAGVTTVTSMYRTTSGTGAFIRRSMMAQPAA